jgi:beta propeller repeat protein
MKAYKKLCSIAFISAILILLLVLVSSAASVSPKITNTRITTSGSAENPAIYGNKIVWSDNRSGKMDIYMYDILTKKESRITKSGEANYPAIYGNKIVWYDNRNEKCDVYMYDISTKKESKISKSGAAYNSYPGPDIYNNKIIWAEVNDNYFNELTLFMYNLSTQQETKITDSGDGGVSILGFYGFAIHGDKIVTSNPSGDDRSDIYMYDLLFPGNWSSNSGRAFYPNIYGDKVVWLDDRKNVDDYDAKPDIYMYDFSTKKETQITTSGSAIYPAIYDNRIVYTDSRSGKNNIYMYDLSTKKETKITTNGSDHYSPDIYGNKIVWTDSRNGKSDIYIGTLK